MTQQQSNYSRNSYNTTELTLNVMLRCAERIGKDIHDNQVADRLYDICSDLESWPEDEGFGTSDHYTYIKQAKDTFMNPPDK